MLLENVVDCSRLYSFDFPGQFLECVLVLRSTTQFSRTA